MFGRLVKTGSVLFAVLLLCMCFVSGQVLASGCEHEWSEWTGENGRHSCVCTLCGSTQDGECSYRSIVKRPACTEGGYTEKICTVCGDTLRVNPTAARGHSWDEGVCTVPATCVDTGINLFTCTVCRAQKEEVIAATGQHTVVEDAAVAADCKQTGLTAGAHCSVCDLVIIEQQEIPKTAHEWDMQNITVTVAPTCVPGQEQTKCLHCGKIGTRSVPAVQEHGYKVTVIPVNPTCETDGHTETAICPTCNTVMKEPVVLPAKGHNWEITVHAEPTCSEDGFCDRYCDRCKTEEKYARIPATGHNYVTQSAKAPTCTQSGYTASCSCSICGDVLAQRETVPALGHHYELISDREPTCTANGKKVYRCKRCSEEKAETADKLGHDLYIASETAATCTSAGAVIKKCRRCTHSLTQSIAARGHDEKYEVVAATCTEGGYTVVTCSRCSLSDRINLTEAAGHKGVLVQQIKPDCTKGGYDQYCCSVCGYEYRQNITDITDHTWGPGLLTKPTCTEGGYTTFQCLYCKQTKKGNEVPANGHTLQSAVSSGDGKHAGACTVCMAAVSEPCSGGTLSCLQAAVCAVCGGNYGNPTGKHNFTKWTVVNASYHRLDCADCDTHGENNEKHSFQQGDFVKEISAFTYTCKQCAHTVWGRPIGDVDGDGVISSVTDARAALRFAVGLDTPQAVALSAADVDRDGNVTTADARLLLRAAVGLESVSRSVLFVDENGNLPN